MSLDAEGADYHHGQFGALSKRPLKLGAWLQPSTRRLLLQFQVPTSAIDDWQLITQAPGAAHEQFSRTRCTSLERVTTLPR